MGNDLKESASRLVCKLREVLEKNRDSFSTEDRAVIKDAIEMLENHASESTSLLRTQTVDIVILVLRILAGSGLLDKIMGS